MIESDSLKIWITDLMVLSDGKLLWYLQSIIFGSIHNFFGVGGWEVENFVGNRKHSV